MIVRNQKFSANKTVIFSILFIILFGTILLKLPISQRVSISLIDCFITATSSACITGVLTVPFDSFTLFGKIIIMLLIQIGGIGLITLSLFLVSLFSELGIATKIMAGKIFELDSIKKVKEVIVFIILFTLTLEFMGAVATYFIIKNQYSLQDAIFNSIFHSISSFCSAGLSCFGNSLTMYQNNIPMLLVTSILILGGTLGFTIWYELFEKIFCKITKRRSVLSLTSKVIIKATTYLILSAMLLLLFFEGKSHFADQPWYIYLTNMLFNAISYRSTGFTTIDANSMQMATVFLIIMYSLIGSSPCSTGSGIKITTFVLFLATIKSVINGRAWVELDFRRIPQDQIFKALAILTLSFCWIIVSNFLLLLCETDKTFIQIFFETVSTFTTLGLATDTTPMLSVAGKLIVCINMFIGRLGVLTILLAFQRRSGTEFQYPEERIMIS